MKIVIDLPEDIYECALDMKMRCPKLIIEAIKNGIPLIEGNNRLVNDAIEIIDVIGGRLDDTFRGL